MENAKIDVWEHAHLLIISSSYGKRQNWRLGTRLLTNHIPIMWKTLKCASGNTPIDLLSHYHVESVIISTYGKLHNLRLRTRSLTFHIIIVFATLQFASWNTPIK